MPYDVAKGSIGQISVSSIIELQYPHASICWRCAVCLQGGRAGGGRPEAPPQIKPEICTGGTSLPLGGGGCPGTCEDGVHGARLGQIAELGRTSRIEAEGGSLTRNPNINKDQHGLPSPWKRTHEPKVPWRDPARLRGALLRAQLPLLSFPEPPLGSQTLPTSAWCPIAASGRAVQTR